MTELTTAGAEASVLDHRFGASAAYTLGVEEEYMLLDPHTWDLVQHIDSMLAKIDEGEFQARVMPELMQSMIEITTPVCRTPAEVDQQLRKLRRYVAELARADGCRFASAGTHPFSLFERQRITAKDRYRKLVDQMQYIARRELIFGMHVHAAVDDPDKAIQVANGLLIHLPGVPGALGQLAVLARRADGALLLAADDLLRLPALGRAAAVRELRGVRRADRPARAHRLHRRLHAHLVGHPPPPAARHGRAADLRRGHARRGRGRARRLLPGAREDALRARRVGRDAAELPPDPHHREQVARRAPRPRGAR